MADERLTNWPVLDITPKEHVELSIFGSQERICLAFEKRKKEFDLRIERLRDEYDAETKRMKDEMANILLYQIKLHGIDATRKKAIPAYTFTRFPDLPKEIQLNIWSLATRLEEAREYYIAPSTPRDPSEISCKAGDGSFSEKPSYPLILDVCQDSRKLALKVYTQMVPSEDDSSVNFWGEKYVNTLYGEFYIFGKTWSNYKVLVNMFLKARTYGGPIYDDEAEIACFANIRHLKLELCIFAEAPNILWTKFPKLEVLTICFYASTETFGEERDFNGENSYMRRIQLVRPLPKSLFGKRAAWLRYFATALFQETQKDFAQCRGWRMPRIEALVITDRLGETDELDGWEGHLGEEEDNTIEAGDVPNLEITETKNQQRGPRVPREDVNWYRETLAMQQQDVDKTAVRDLRDWTHNLSRGGLRLQLGI